jgi:DNA-binding LytR/AlgR family response regulator
LHLLQECGDVEMVGSVGDGEAALAVLTDVHPDLLLLDINMPGLDGKALAARLANRSRPVIVFCTAYEAHALHAFDLGAVDYLLKPVRVERFAMRSSACNNGSIRISANRPAGCMRVCAANPCAWRWTM